MAIPPETKVPALPDPNQDPQGFLRAAKEIVEVREGARGNSLDRAVTFRDLVDAGLAAPNRAIAGKGRMPASAIITPSGSGGAGGNIGTGVKPVMTTPPKPRDVTAVGTFGSILIAWAQPDYANHAYTEILRADIDDIGQAVVIGSSVGGQYADAVGESATKYYWVRFVSTSNVKGAASTVVMGKTALNPEFVMANLLATIWQPNTAYQQFQYVKPTVDNGMMYRCVMDGVSGSTEPIWPTTIGQKRNDGTTQWLTVEASERVPFIIGTVNGEPAVVMDTAYIGDATITIAKIEEAFLDNLTAIHGTLHFARIEHGNIFELTIGGEIRSTVFSPLNKQGFIIRAEPGRDPDTPTMREYVAEFYGDTLFSGDVRAARVLGGMIVGASFGVPSDLDNGSFEFIAEREVVADAVAVNRLDATGITENISFAFDGDGYDIEVGNFSINGPITVSILYNIYFRRHHPFAGFTIRNEPVPLLNGLPIEVRNYGGKNVSSLYRTLQRSNKLFLNASMYAQVLSNPLSIISANAVSPYNYNRYRHVNVSAMISYTRDCYTAFDYTIGDPSNPLVAAVNDYYPSDGKKSTWFYVQCGSLAYYQVIVVPENTKCTVTLSKYNWNADNTAYATTHRTITIIPSRPSSSSVFFYHNDSSVEISLILDQTVTNGNIPGVNEQNCFTKIKKDSFILIKDIAFNAKQATGLSLLVSQAYGLDIGVNFSSAMDNSV